MKLRGERKACDNQARSSRVSTRIQSSPPYIIRDMTATITVVTPDSLFSEMAVKPANTAITALAYESLFFGNGEKVRRDIRLARPNNSTASMITLILQATAAPAAPNLRIRTTAKRT